MTGRRRDQEELEGPQGALDALARPAPGDDRRQGGGHRGRQEQQRLRQVHRDGVDAERRAAGDESHEDLVDPEVQEEGQAADPEPQAEAERAAEERQVQPAEAGPGDRRRDPVRAGDDLPDDPGHRDVRDVQLERFGEDHDDRGVEPRPRHDDRGPLRDGTDALQEVLGRGHHRVRADRRDEQRELERADARRPQLTQELEAEDRHQPHDQGARGGEREQVREQRAALPAVGREDHRRLGQAEGRDPGDHLCRDEEEGRGAAALRAEGPGDEQHRDEQAGVADELSQKEQPAPTGERVGGAAADLRGARLVQDVAASVGVPVLRRPCHASIASGTARTTQKWRQWRMSMKNP
jgi:hypothetical protein